MSSLADAIGLCGAEVEDQSFCSRKNCVDMPCCPGFSCDKRNAQEQFNFVMMYDVMRCDVQ
jgi:hypothetical protein